MKVNEATQKAWVPCDMGRLPLKFFKPCESWDIITFLSTGAAFCPSTCWERFLESRFQFAVVQFPAIQGKVHAA